MSIWNSVALSRILFPSTQSGLARFENRGLSTQSHPLPVDSARIQLKPSQVLAQEKRRQALQPATLASLPQHKKKPFAVQLVNQGHSRGWMQSVSLATSKALGRRREVAQASKTNPGGHSVQYEPRTETSMKPMINGLQPEPLLEMSWRHGRAYTELLKVRRELGERRLAINGISNKLHHLNLRAAQGRSDVINSSTMSSAHAARPAKHVQNPSEQPPQSMFDGRFRMRQTGEPVGCDHCLPL